MMNEKKRQSRVPVVDYADPKLPTGSVFQQLEYPSDRIGFLNPARLVDTGDTITLEPAGLVWRIVGLCVLMAALGLGGSYRAVHHRFEFLIAWVVIAIIFITYAIYRSRKRNRTPWIVVTRSQRTIYLPRARRTIRFADTFRLQVISFGTIGWSANYLGYHGDPGTGEVQLVFNEKKRQETWCVVTWPDERMLKRFLVAFYKASGIPIARALHRASGEWEVEPFDEIGDRPDSP